MTEWQKLERSRNRRLWIGQVIIPAATAFGVAMTNPEFKNKVMTTVNKGKAWAKNKIDQIKK